jgi:hypothetical protein
MSKIRFAVLATALALAPLATACGQVDQPAAPVQPVDASSKPNASASRPATPPIELTAKAVKLQAQEFVETGPQTCVMVTITNHTKTQVESNPLFFAITGTDGTKHEIAIGVDRREIADVQLAPGENGKGVVCADGTFTPAVVAFDDFVHQARAQVAK